ncbi:hypothetical protein PPSIR1_20954 [Plesiocystis pacifica SIR-1]|uniref:Uncharacterized protein n=1 Tax=Plesiocystis pacifica SIR-1 TaxID=391625 RepID=A6G3D0_9BACT|nr:hypothetical protein PPSIR1_20954 [Plesiocystis pacifica SIR-1]
MIGSTRDEATVIDHLGLKRSFAQVAGLSRAGKLSKSAIDDEETQLPARWISANVILEEVVG